MIKKIIKILKRLIMAVLFIYSYNQLAFPLNVILPINIITVVLVMVFGIPSVIMMFIFFKFLI